MSLTLTNLIDLCAADLADSEHGTWEAADIETWCRDAIADYGQHFQKLEETTISCAAGERMYDLPLLFAAPVSVEYPAGQSPPLYLRRGSFGAEDFWISEGLYDVFFRFDSTDPDALLISVRPSAGQTIVVTYKAHYDSQIATSAQVEVPAYHQHILRNYVMWRAAAQRLAAEEAAPTSNSSLLMNQYAVTADRLRRAYHDSLAKALYALSDGGPVRWASPGPEGRRIY